MFRYATPVDGICLNQLAVQPIKRSTVLNVMRHALPGRLAAWPARITWYKANLFHLGSPLFIVVAVTRRSAKLVLPFMHHFVHQSAQDLPLIAFQKRIWIESYFRSTFAISVAELFGVEITVGVAMAL